VIVRNVAGDTYPERPVPGSRETWHIAHPRWADHAAVCLEVRRWLGWQKPDGTWDRDEASGPALRNWPQNGHASAEQRQAEDRAHRERVLLEAAIPKEERVTVIGLAWLGDSRARLLAALAFLSRAARPPSARVGRAPNRHRDPA
jgi:hypothetical protein